MSTTVGPLERTRQRLGDALFARVAGPDGNDARRRVHGTEGPRWFPPGSAIRRVHGDASAYIGGLRALLLQSLHPLAMAGVAGHSGYRGDPWGRLARTSTFLAFTTFGAADDAQAMVDRVRAVHERVRGKAPDGRPYRASDPHLLTWIHIAEADSFLRAHQRYGERPLDAAQADEYVRQAGTVALKLGAIEVPNYGLGARRPSAAIPPRTRGNTRRSRHRTIPPQRATTALGRAPAVSADRRGCRGAAAHLGTHGTGRRRAADKQRRADGRHLRHARSALGTWNCAAAPSARLPRPLNSGRQRPRLLEPANLAAGLELAVRDL